MLMDRGALLQPRWVGLVVRAGDKIYGFTSETFLPKGQQDTWHPSREKAVYDVAAVTNLVENPQKKIGTGTVAYVSRIQSSSHKQVHCLSYQVVKFLKPDMDLTHLVACWCYELQVADIQ